MIDPVDQNHTTVKIHPIETIGGRGHCCTLAGCGCFTALNIIHNRPLSILAENNFSGRPWSLGSRGGRGGGRTRQSIGRASAEHRRRPWRAARRSAEHRAAGGWRTRQSIGRRPWRVALAIVIIPPTRAASPLSAEGPTGPVVSIVILGHLLKYTTQSAVVKSGGKIHHRPAAAARRSEVAAELRAADNWRAAVTIGRASAARRSEVAAAELGRASGGGRGGRPWRAAVVARKSRPVANSAQQNGHPCGRPVAGGRASGGGRYSPSYSS